MIHRTLSLSPVAQRKRPGRPACLRTLGKALLAAAQWSVLATLTAAPLSTSAQPQASQPAAAANPEGFYSLDPKLFDLEKAYLAWPVAPADKAYASINGDHIKGMATELSDIALRSKTIGIQFWGRVTGSQADLQTRAYVQSKFKTIGLHDVRVEELPMPPQYRPKSWRVSIAGSALASSFPIGTSPGTVAGGMDVPLAWGGLGTAADLNGREMRGKAVLIYSYPAPSVLGQTASFNGALERVQKAGAAAILVALDIPGNASSQMGRAPEQSIPMFTIGRDDGNRLRAAIESAAAAKIHIEMDASRIPGLTAANIWGVLPGMTDENVLITAHTDSYFTGAVDNASGVATMLALAEYFSKIPKEQRRRTITFVATGGHHEGSLGVQAIHDKMQPLLKKTALIVNSANTTMNDIYIWNSPTDIRRSTQISGQTMFTLKGSDAMKQITLNAFASFGVGTLDQPEARANGDISPIFLDAPSLQLFAVPLTYHTDLDTVEMLPAPGLANAARAFAKIIAQTDKLSMSEMRAGMAASP